MWRRKFLACAMGLAGGQFLGRRRGPCPIRETSDQLAVEMAVLGAMMRDPRKIPRIARLVHSSHFSDFRHAVVYRMVIDCFRRSGTAGPSVVEAALLEEDLIEEAGGCGYIAEIMDADPRRNGA